MKRLTILATILIACNLTLYSQTDMKKKNYFGIDVQELSEKEMNLILNENNLKSTEHIGGDIVHYLSNGSVIFEMENIKGYLFNNTDDFNKFIERSSKPQPIGDSMLTYTHPIKDSLFIDKIEQYVTFFFGQHNFTLDFGDKGDLEKFDKILNQLKVEELKKYRLSIVAIIGEFIVNNCYNANWKYLNIPNSQKEKQPVIMINNNTTLIVPAQIFYDQYNQRLDKSNYKINTKRSILNYINSCK